MQVLSSLKAAKQRHRDCQIVRRRGKVYVICNPIHDLKRDNDKKQPAHSIC